MKKLLTLVLSLIVAFSCFSLTACNKNKENEEEAPVVGLICLHGENSTYDKNFITAFKTACANKGVSYKIVVDIAESQACYDAAVELIDEGCKVLFADSFGHEPFMMAAAEEYPDVEFCHATGTQAKQSNLANYHNAFASIYEGRYLAGYAAGLKLLTMPEKAVDGNFHVGYVGALDITKYFNDQGTNSYEPMLPYLVMAVLYIVIVAIIASLVKLLERSLAKNERRKS